MPSLLGDDDPRLGLLGIPGAQVLRIEQPDPDKPDQGRALAQTYNKVSQYLQEQQQRSIDEGYWTGGQVWEGGHPTERGLIDAAQQYGSGMLMGSTAPGVRAYHGSPHSFERFDIGKIGTGEGAQAYGHGLYFAENEGVARGYRDELAGFKLAFPSKEAQSLFDTLPKPHQDIIQSKLQAGAKPAEIRSFLENLADGARRQADYVAQGGRGSVNYGPDEMATADAATKLAAMRSLPKSTPAGSMYEVNIKADPEQFLHWDKPLSQQHPVVQDAVNRVARDPRFAMDRITDDMSGAQLKSLLSNPEATAALREAGVPGIRYLDQGSRGSGEGTHNLVVFDDATIELLRKSGLAGLMVGGGAAALGAGSQAQAREPQR